MGTEDTGSGADRAIRRPDTNPVVRKGVPDRPKGSIPDLSADLPAGEIL